jgi:methyl-accepting chemotaxis protein
VVAQEVKALAAQTEKATHKITQQISTIDLTTSNVVHAMKAIAGTIRQLDVNATDISESVQQQDLVTKDIARSASIAAEETRVVSSGLARVAEAALKSDKVATAVLNAGGELADRSNKLRAQVEYFLAQVRVV